MSKTIFRVEKNPDNPFVMIDKRPLENSALSWKAKGVLAYLLSRPDNWVVRLEDLIRRATDGPGAIRSALRELRQAGHMHMKTNREDGQFQGWVYEVYELPFAPDPTLKPPFSDFPQVEKPQVEKRTLNNTKRTKKKESTKKKEGGTSAPHPPKAKDFPSNVLYRAVTDKWPKKVNWEGVLLSMEKIKQRLGREPLKDDLLPYYAAWCAAGWNEWSINWLDYAVKGTMPNQGAQKSSNYENNMGMLHKWLEGAPNGGQD